MQTIKTELVVNGRKVVIGHQFLEDKDKDFDVAKQALEGR